MPTKVDSSFLECWAEKDSESKSALGRKNCKMGGVGVGR